MAVFKDLTGLEFGRLKVLSFSREVKSGKRYRKYWICKCDCGNEKEIRTDSLTSGFVKSCGCLKEEQNKINLIKNHSHKQSGKRLYHIWQGIKNRCLDVNNHRYSRYGGRGISICEEWLVPDNFFNWAFENGYEEHLTIDRIDNDRNYEPSNCRWTTAKEQNRNRSTNIKIEYEGKEITLVELSEITGISYGCLNARYNKGKRGYELIKPVLKYANTEVINQIAKG